MAEPNAQPDFLSQKLTRRSLLKALGVVTVGAVTVPELLSACGSAGSTPSSSASASAGGSIANLSVGLPNSISTLNLMHEAGIINYVIALLSLESLLGVGPDGALTPALAASWRQVGGESFVYTLRPGAKFSDGTPLTVDDVIASIEANAKKGSTSDLNYAYAGVKSVKATGADEVTIELDSPNAMFAWTTSPGSLQVTSKAFLAKHGSSFGTPGVGILGTGPYKLAEFQPGSQVTMVRNEHWWGGAVPVEQVSFKFISDDTTRLYALRSGSIQMALNVPTDQIAQWKQVNGASVEVATDNSLVTLAFNTKKAPWNDVHVRKAVAHSIDRPGIIKSIFGGYGQVAVTFPTKSEWGGLLNPQQVDALYQSIPQYEFDMTQAKQELAASTVPHGFSDTVTYPNSGPQIGQALLTLSQNLKQIGIQLAVKEVTLEQWIADLGNHQLGIYTGWYFAVTGDPAEYAQQLLNGANAGPQGTNIAQYQNAAVTKALDESQRTSGSARAGLIGQALVQSAADVPYQPLWWGEGATAFGPHVAASNYGPYFFVGPWATQVHAT